MVIVRRAAGLLWIAESQVCVMLIVGAAWPESMHELLDTHGRNLSDVQ